MSYQRTNYRSPYQTCTGSTPVSTTQTVYSYITPIPNAYATYHYNGNGASGYLGWSTTKAAWPSTTTNKISLSTDGKSITFEQAGAYTINFLIYSATDNDGTPGKLTTMYKNNVPQQYQATRQTSGIYQAYKRDLHETQINVNAGDVIYFATGDTSEPTTSQINGFINICQVN